MINLKFPGNSDPSESTSNIITNAITSGLGKLTKTISSSIESSLSKGLGSGLFAKAASGAVRAASEISSDKIVKKKRVSESTEIEEQKEEEKSILKKGFEGLKNATTLVGDKLDNVGTSITQGIGDEVASSINDKLGGGLFAKSLTSITNYFKENFMPALKGILKAPFNFISSTYKSTVDMFKKIGTSIKGILKAPFNFISSTYKSTVDMFKKIGTSISDGFMYVGSSIKNVSQSIFKMSESLIKGIGKSIGKFSEWFIGVIPLIGGFLLSGLKGVFSLGGNIFGGLTKGILGLMPILGNLLKFAGPFGKIALVGTGIFKFVDWLSKISGGKGIIADTLDLFQNFSARMKDVEDVLSWLGNKIADTFKGIGKKILEILNPFNWFGSDDKDAEARAAKYASVNTSVDRTIDVAKNANETLKALGTLVTPVNNTVINNVTPINNISDNSSSVSMPASLNATNYESSFNMFNKSFAY